MLSFLTIMTKEDKNLNNSKLIQNIKFLIKLIDMEEPRT